MELQQLLREYLVTEFHSVSKGIKDSPDMSTVAYNFSACYSAISRVLNIEFDIDLVLLHFVFNGCYNTILNRVTKLNQNAELQVQFPPDFSEKLSGIVDEFAVRFNDNRDFLDLLSSLTNLCYVVTGNGHFLYQTGRLTI